MTKDGLPCLQQLIQIFPNAKSDYHITPNMDALLKMGVSFTNGYAAAPVCAPSRYSIQFGKTAARVKRTIARGPELRRS
jgi:arylsulfatase A-like enzyme